MSVFTLSKTWQVLGPFPIGTREEDFGADPLENYGNILKPNIVIIMGPLLYICFIATTENPLLSKSFFNEF
jgi:hypothetical protein